MLGPALLLRQDQHLFQGVGRIHRAIDHDVCDVNALRRELRVEFLAEHSPPAHRGRVMLIGGSP
jgi:hypothetical protein